MRLYKNRGEYDQSLTLISQKVPVKLCPYTKIHNRGLVQNSSPAINLRKSENLSVSQEYCLIIGQLIPQALSFALALKDKIKSVSFGWGGDKKQATNSALFLSEIEIHESVS